MVVVNKINKKDIYNFLDKDLENLNNYARKRNIIKNVSFIAILISIAIFIHIVTLLKSPSYVNTIEGNILPAIEMVIFVFILGLGICNFLFSVSEKKYALDKIIKIEKMKKMDEKKLIDTMMDNSSYYSNIKNINLINKLIEKKIIKTIIEHDTDKSYCKIIFYYQDKGKHEILKISTCADLHYHDNETFDERYAKNQSSCYMIVTNNNVDLYTDFNLIDKELTINENELIEIV